MSETDLQLGGGYTYQWECAILLALNYFFEPVRYNPTLFDLVHDFLGQVAEIHLEGEDRESGVDLEDINLVNRDRRILIQVKTKQAARERWAPTDPLFLKTLYRFYGNRFFIEQPEDTRFVFLTNRPFNPALVRVKSAIRSGTLDQSVDADRLHRHLARYAQREKGTSIDAGRFREMLARTALVEYMAVDGVKANVQAKLQAHGRRDWPQAHALLFEHFARRSTRVGGGTVTRASVVEILGSPLTQPLPKRTRAHILEGLSLRHIETILSPEWICRRVEDDYGLDLRVEIVADGQVTGLEFSIQLKATDDLKISGDDVLHRCNVSTAHYFLRRPEPVMYLVYDARGEAAYWLWVQPYLRELDKTRPRWRDQKTVQIRIPRANQLTPESAPAIADAVQAQWARVAPAVGWKYAPSPQAAPRPFQLPPDLPTFTGREGYLAKLDNLLQPGSGRTVGLVWLCGMAGVGKSALAIHAAHRWGHRFRDGVVWVDLRQGDVPSALRHIAATYGYSDQAAQVFDPEGLAALVRSVLHEREVLLVLDGGEGVPPEEFPLLLPGASDCVTLATSRRAFTELTRHGQVFRVGVMSEREAQALLARTLGSAPDEAEGGARSDLVKRLGGLPMALDIAARQMAARGWSAVGYLSRLERASSLVAELSLPLADRREESVALAFALSYEALDERQQRLFRALGAMAEGGFAPASVAGMLVQKSDEVERELEELALLSLLRPEEVLGRYELNLLLADYSRTLAREAGEWERLRSAHLEYYVAYVQQHTRDYPALKAELANLMAAGEWSLQSGENNGVLALTEWLHAGGGEFLNLRGYTREAVRLLTWATEAAHALGDRRGEGNRLSNLGNAYRDLGEAGRAIECYQQTFQIAQEIGDRRMEGNALGNLGLIYRALGEVGQAIEYCQQALQIAREIGDRRGEGAWLRGLGLAHSDLGEMGRAIEYYEQALEISREIGDRRSEGIHLGNLGLIYRALGEVGQAVEYYQQALQIAREIGDRRSEGIHLGNLGLAYSDLGEVWQAIEYYQQALRIAREIGDQRSEGIHLGNLGLAYSDLGEMRQAIEYYQQALEISREIGDRRGEGNHLSNLGNAYRDLGEAGRAIECYQQALQMAQEIGDWRGEGNRLGNLGLAYRVLGEVGRAIEHCQQALQIAREIGDRRDEGAWLGSLGLAYSDLGEVGRAIEYHQQALQIAREIGDRRNEGAWLGSLGNIYRVQGEVKRALEYYQQALQIAREIGDRRGEGNRLNNLGLAYSALGEVEWAIDCYRQALQIAREIGDRLEQGVALRNLANVYADLGEVQQAIGFYEQALAISREIGNRRTEQQILNNLGSAHGTLGQAERAMDYYKQALTIARQGKELPRVAEILLSLGSLARDNEQFDQAKRFWEESRNIYRDLNSPYEPTVLSLLDELMSTQGSLISLVEMAQRFFRAAGFELISGQEETAFLCQPKDRVWQRKFSQPIAVEIVCGSPLDGKKVRALCRSATRTLGDKPIILVVIDRTPTNSGWLQIGTMRAEDVQVIPIDDTVLLEGQERRRQQQVLEKHLSRFLGREQDFYNVRHPVADRLNFFGREALTHELMEDLIEGRSLALFGLRKMGKSSFLMYLRDKLPFPTALVDLQAGVELDSLYGRILTSWSRSMRVKVRDLDWSAPSLARAPDLSSAFTAATRQLLTLLEDHNVLPRLCLLVDEADLIVPHDGKGVERYLAFARALRGLVQEGEGRFSLLMAGVDPLFNRVNRLAGQQNPFYQFFREIYLPSLDHDDCIQMVRNIGQQMGLVYSDEAVAFVADVSGGHPFLARQLCSLAFQQLGRRGAVPLSHLQGIAERFIREPGKSEILDENGLWGEISNPDLWPRPQVAENQAILKSLAQTEPQPESDLVGCAQDRRACERSLDELERRAVLGRLERTLFNIRLRLFRNWIRRYQLGLE